jgi:O-antigen/teichoic acid export membrane protein
MKAWLRVGRDAMWGGLLYLVPRIAGAATLILVGRIAGPSAAGSFALAATYLLIASTTMRGQDDLVVRETAKHGLSSARSLASPILTRAGLSVLAYGIIAALAKLTLQGNDQGRAAVLILCLAVLPDGLSYLAQAVLVGLGHFSRATGAALVAAAIKVLAVGWALWAGSSLSGLAWAWVAASAIGGGINIAAIWTAWRPTPGLPDQPDLLRAAELTEPAIFVTISILLAVESQADTLLLSAFRTPAEIGLYGAATTVAYAFLVISQGFRLSIYPTMSRLAKRADPALHRIYAESNGLMGILGIGVGLALWFLGPLFVGVLFGPAFGGSVSIIRILAIAVALIFINEPSSRLRLAIQQQKRVLQVVGLATATNVILNLILVPRWGPLGAALAKIASSASILLLNWSGLRRTLSLRSALGGLAIPIAAGVIAVASLPLARALNGTAQALVPLGIYTMAVVLFRLFAHPGGSSFSAP